VELELEGEINTTEGAPDEGMVMDFARVSEVWRPLHARLDHQCLNDVMPEEFHPTTAENIAAFILAELDLAPLVAVRVWETATGWAEVRR
jgi:6-pyruvoyl-tetrahydropterin synthase